MAMEAVRVWTDLGVVETIYEEEHEDFSSTPSLSPSLSSPTPLHSRVKKWSLATGCETDVLIHIQGSCFHLHKFPLASRSGYLKRQLMELSEITLSPPLNITADTFAMVADFCYGTHLVITPFNVAALLTAAELLEMTETNGGNDENLRQKTEAYFCRVVAVNEEYASIVFRSCLSLLPEAEMTASLVSRCIEALSLMGDGDGDISWIDDIKKARTEDFQVIAASMHHQLTESHDLLYRIVDLYLKEHNGKITEEQKIGICNSIDCTMLSPQLLMHAVQNPRMPLRFIVQAMFVEQLNTRRSIFSATKTDHKTRKRNSKDVITLGAILQRDAALRQVAQLKAAMDSTSSRIQSLERELNGMKSLLRDSQVTRRNALLLDQSGRSASFRFSSETENKIERRCGGGGYSSSEGSCDGSPRPRVLEKYFGRKLIHGLKSAFRASKQIKSESSQTKVDGNGDVVVIKKDLPFHRRSRSLV